MIETFFRAIFVFLDILTWVVYIEIILSWLTLIGLHIPHQPIRWILDPIYRRIEAVLPTHFMGISFSAMILIIGIYFCKILVMFLSQSFFGVGIL